MQLQVLGSSSKGNCYVLHTETGSLLIEAGIPFTEIKQALDYDISNIVGALVTHEHKDHSKAVPEVMAAGIDVYMSKGTSEVLNISSHRLHPILSPYDEPFILGDFIIKPFETQHDAKEPLGFLIGYKPKVRGRVETLLFATDTYYLRYKFPDVNYIMIECNYIPEILEWNLAQGLIDITHRNRLLSSHFSLPNVIDFFKANDMQPVKKIVLLHLSDQNSNEKQMQEEIEYATRRPVVVAHAGDIIDLVKHPF